MNKTVVLLSALLILVLGIFFVYRMHKTGFNGLSNQPYVNSTSYNNSSVNQPVPSQAVIQSGSASAANSPSDNTVDPNANPADQQTQSQLNSLDSANRN